MKASVFIGTSVDGLIARANGDRFFLPPGDHPSLRQVDNHRTFLQWQQATALPHSSPRAIAVANRSAALPSPRNNTGSINSTSINTKLPSHSTPSTRA